MFRRSNGAHISPCILAQVKFSLGITIRKPTNRKKCSVYYWNEVVEILGRHYNIQRNIITNNFR